MSALISLLALALVAGGVLALVPRLTRLRRSRRTDAPGDGDAQPRSDDGAPPASITEFESHLTGDVVLRGRTRFPGNVSVRGNLTLEEGATVEGLAEVHGNLVLNARTTLTHPAIVHGNLTLGQGARVRGMRVDGNALVHPDGVVDGPLECETVYLHEAPATPPVAKREAPPQREKPEKEMKAASP